MVDSFRICSSNHDTNQGTSSLSLFLLNSTPYGGGYYVRVGGTGGGAIQLAVGGTLTVDGVLSANGTVGNGDSYYGGPYWGGGGGAGGSLYLTVGALSGTGTITAAGANGYWPSYSGGGAGGRIALYLVSGRKRDK